MCIAREMWNVKEMCNFIKKIASYVLILRNLLVLVNNDHHIQVCYHKCLDVAASVI